MMDYKKFATQVETKISKVSTKRQDLENKIAEAREEAAAAEEKCNMIAQGDDVDAYLAAKTSATQAAEKAEFYSMKLDSFNLYIFTIEQLRTAKAELRKSYTEEQEEIEKVIKDGFKTLRKQLLPLVQKFKEHRDTGNATLQKMTTATDPGDNNNHELEIEALAHSLASGVDVYYEEDINPDKILKFINDTLNDHQ